MATTIRARIYARGEVSFAKFLFLPSCFTKLLEANFSYFTKIIWMLCQTVGVALSERWKGDGRSVGPWRQQSACRDFLIAGRERKQMGSCRRDGRIGDWCEGASPLGHKIRV
jgi:hypothetical protein